MIKVQTLDKASADQITAIEMAATDDPWKVPDLVHLMQHGMKQNCWARVALCGQVVIAWAVWRMYGRTLNCSRFTSYRDQAETEAVKSLIADGIEYGAKVGAVFVSASVRDVDADAVSMFESLRFFRVSEVQFSGDKVIVFQRRLTHGTLQETVQ